jgi:hypothetical protein
VDDVKFMQVITNLLSNSTKFTPDNGEISIRVDDHEEAGTVLITIRDNGIGIPEKYHAALFDKFTKARRPGLRQEPPPGWACPSSKPSSSGTAARSGLKAKKTGALLSSWKSPGSNRPVAAPERQSNDPGPGKSSPCLHQ